MILPEGRRTLLQHFLGTGTPPRGSGGADWTLSVLGIAARESKSEANTANKKLSAARRKPGTHREATTNTISMQVATCPFNPFGVWRIWPTCPSMHRKTQIFNTCVGSQLLYCLHTAWLNKAELRKLDGFHARCLRKILGIPHPFISRVSDCDVYKRGKCRPYSKTLTCRQLMLFHKVMTLPPTDARRTCMCEADSLTLLQHTQCRRRGSPRNTWGPQVYNMAIRVANNVDSLESIGSLSPKVWQHKVDQFFSLCE